MTYDSAYKQHFEWLQKQAEEKRKTVAEAEVVFLQARAELAYFERAIENMLPEAVPSSSDETVRLPSGSLNEDHNDNKEVVGSQMPMPTHSQAPAHSSSSSSKRTPRNMLRPEFSDKTLSEVALLILEKQGKAMSVEEIAKLVFITKGEDEFFRSKNSLSTELRRGAKEDRWKQVGRALFVSKNSFDLEEDKNSEHQTSNPTESDGEISNGLSSGSNQNSMPLNS